MAPRTPRSRRCGQPKPSGVSSGGAEGVTTADVECGTTFTATRNLFESLLAWLAGAQAAALSHGALEDRLQVDARELIRQALQEHLDQRAASEPDLGPVIDAQQMARPTTETGHHRSLATVFGPVQVTARPTANAAGQTCTRPTPR